MAGIQVGGIVSGLDTNALVEQLTESANIAVERLNGDYSFKSLEYNLYDDMNDMCSNLSTDLLSLRLSSTYLTKQTSSTNEGVGTATATTDADIGSFSLKVLQTARNSEATSNFTKVDMVTSGANVADISGYANESLEGRHTTTIYTTGASQYLSIDVFEVQNIGTMTKQVGDAYSNVDSSGNLVADVSGSLKFSYTDADGNAQTLTISGTYGTAGQDINTVSTTIQDTLNGALNSTLGTNDVTYAAVRADYDKDAGTWSFALYETTITDYNIAIAGDDAGTLSDELGFSELSAPTVSTETTIKKYHLADDAAALQNKLASSVAGLIPGASLSISATIEPGKFVYSQDASLNISSTTKSTYVSDSVTTGTLDTAVEGLENAGFTETADTSLNGTFTINDVTITIDDYTALSVQDVLGIINASGAGVTASYDATYEKFILTSNTAGAKSISLGSFSDTSDLLDFFGFGAGDDTDYTIGTTSGSISTDVKLSNSGLTTYPSTGTFTINGVSIYVDPTVDTMEDLIEKVNNSGAGVTMTYDSTSDKISLKSDGIEPITVGSSTDTSNILEAFHLTKDSTVETTIGTEGQRAIFQVNGDTYIRDTNEVDDVLAGVTITLNAASDETTTIKVTTDTSKAVDALATFIMHYNELMEKLNVPDKEDKEDDYTDYLTSSDKESMSDDDIAKYQEYYELYNEYDIIRRSSELRNMRTTMRTAVFAERSGINGSVNDMSDLGIEVAGAGDLDTENYGYLVSLSTDHDTLVAALEDNDTLMTMLTENPKDVYKFFSNLSDLDTDDAETDAEAAAMEKQIEAEAGWARYFDDYVLERYTAYNGFIGSKIGSTGTIQRELDKLESRISTQEDRVETELERYWAKFSAMEQAIAEAQSQGNALSSITGSSG
ncbi:MAG: flagellar filament capping protein FliD [Deferribacterales bacterium]